MVYELRCHPNTRASTVQSVVVEFDGDTLSFRVNPAEAVLVSAPKPAMRTDELWRMTCFELFWKPLCGEAYVELNLSPSTAWAAYAFDGYRAGMRDLILLRDPVVQRTADGIRTRLDLSGLQRPAQVGLSAVIEETDGTKSYWALAHPSGAPDFHHPDCFALKVPAVA